MTATRPSWPAQISQSTPAEPRRYEPLWNDSSIGGTMRRTLAKTFFVAADMLRSSVDIAGSSSR